MADNVASKGLIFFEIPKNIEILFFRFVTVRSFKIEK